MIVKITSYPPLAQQTVISHSASIVHFHVCLETQKNCEWHVEIWHNLKSAADWSAQKLALLHNHPLEVFSSAPEAFQGHRKWYSGALRGHFTHPVSFTIRFQADAGTEFVWTRDETGQGDGILLPQPELSNFEQDGLSSFLKDFDQKLRIERARSDTPGTCLWTVSAPAIASKGDDAGCTTYIVGKPVDLARWFAITRLTGMWLGPRHGYDFPLAEKDALLYSFLRTDGLHIVVLAISGIGDEITLLRQQDDSLAAFTRNDSDKDGVMRLAVAVGSTFEEANAAVMYHARGLLAESNPLSLGKREMVTNLKHNPATSTENEVMTTWREDWSDGFTYCTWNALGQDLTEEKILGALDALKSNGIGISNLIIDDGWQSVDHSDQNQERRGWSHFEAHPQGFRKGLKQTIATVRQKYPDIKHIAVWHALLGYWGGISPLGSIVQNYKLTQLEPPTPAFGNKFYAVDATDIRRMYNDFYSFLSQCGVDAVKTDCQYLLEDMQPTPTRRNLSNTYYNAWTTAQLRHFSGRAISCMSQTPTIIFRTLLQHNMPPVTFRNSDDFFPNVRESHPWHIFCNAHNALMTSMLNVTPDWDMFQTGHEWAPFHAAARCVSGGPIYITDVPGEHNLDVVGAMTARTIRGQVVVLRCGCVGRSLRVYNGFEEERFCLIGAYHGGKGTGASVVGVFNCLDTPITEILPLETFMGIEENTQYVVRSHRTGKISTPLQKGTAGAIISLSLTNFDWDILTATPITSVSSTQHLTSVPVATLGLLGKMSGIAALLNMTADFEHSGKRIRISVTLKALGRLGIWISGLHDNKQELEDDLMVTISSHGVPWGCIATSPGNEVGSMLEIDVEQAWVELGLNAGWSNEVEVVVFYTPH